jgi:ferric iron reductase protein FhuF
MQAHVEHYFFIENRNQTSHTKKPIENLKFFQWTQKKRLSQPLTQNKKEKIHIPLPPFQKKKILGLWGVWYILISCM